MIPGNAWRRPDAGEGFAVEVACGRFLARHSAYLDGELTAEERAAHEAHEASCGSCARYASVLRRGSGTLRQLPEITPSADFQARLQHRLYHVRDEAVLTPRRGRWRGPLAAAATLTVLAGGPALLERWPSDAPPPAAPVLTSQESRDRGLAFATTWQTPVVPVARTAPPLPPVTTGYTPVVVQPPQYQPAVYQLLAGE